MSWCTLYAASLKPRESSIETCLIVIAHNCYSRLEYTFRAPVSFSTQYSLDNIREDIYSLIQTAVEWGASLMSNNEHLATIDIGDIYYFDPLSMVFHAHLDERVAVILTDIANNYGWTVQRLSKAQTFNQEIQRVNQQITPVDLCSLCLNTLGSLQHSNIDKLLNHKPSGPQRNAAPTDKGNAVCERELQRIGQAIACGNIVSFRPIFQDPPNMSFCAKTLTELMIAFNEQQACSWDPYDSALCSLLEMLKRGHQGSVYFLHKAKKMFPDNLFKNILISILSDLRSLIRLLPSPELKYTSAKYLEEDINSHIYKLLQSPSLRSTIYEFAGSFSRLFPYYFEHEHIHVTQLNSRGHVKIYQNCYDPPSDNYINDMILRLDSSLSNISLARPVSVSKAMHNHLANRFINQSVPESVTNSLYFNLCYGTRFLVMLNCLTMLLHAKLIMTQILMTSYESICILRSCMNKDPVMVESVVKAKIPLSASKREFLVRFLKSNYFVQNIINDIWFLQGSILSTAETERQKALDLIRKKLERNMEGSTSDPDGDLPTNNNEENLSQSNDTDNGIGVSIQLLDDINICHSTNNNSCIEDDSSVDETLFRASKSPTNEPSLMNLGNIFINSPSEQSTDSSDETSISFTNIDSSVTQGYLVRHKNVYEAVVSILRRAKKERELGKTNLERQKDVIPVAYARTSVAPIICPDIQKKVINMVSRIKNNYSA